MTTNPYALKLTRFSTHQQIVNLVGTKQRVLDVGCNDGYLGTSSDGTNIFYGLDYSPSSIKKAKRYYNDALCYDLNNLKALPWNEPFDVIIMADVLEHVIDPAGCLKFFTENYLKDDGQIIISLPNVANWQIRLALLLGKFNYTDSGIMDRTHLHFYTYKSARKLVRGAGLRIQLTFAGSSILGYLAYYLPFLKPLVASSIIIHAKK